MTGRGSWHRSGRLKAKRVKRAGKNSKVRCGVANATFWFIVAGEEKVIMENLAHITKLKALGYQNKYHYLEEALSRNTGFISKAEQDRLINAKVAIPGLGGVGGAHLVTLARMGIGRFHLADFDVFEPANLNRQYGAKTSQLGRSKLDVMIEEVMNINPYLEIRKFPDGVGKHNLKAFLNDVDVVVDGIDFFNFDARRMVALLTGGSVLPRDTASEAEQGQEVGA